MPACCGSATSPKAAASTPRTRNGVRGRGKQLSGVARFADAEPVLSEAVNQAAGLVAYYPDRLAYQQTHADSTNQLGYVFQKTGRGDMAGEAYRQAVDRLEKVVASA